MGFSNFLFVDGERYTWEIDETVNLFSNFGAENRFFRVFVNFPIFFIQIFLLILILENPNKKNQIPEIFILFYFLKFYSELFHFSI